MQFLGLHCQVNEFAFDPFFPKELPKAEVQPEVSEVAGSLVAIHRVRCILKLLWRDSTFEKQGNNVKDDGCSAQFSMGY